MKRYVLSGLLACGLAAYSMLAGAVYLGSIPGPRGLVLRANASLGEAHAALNSDAPTPDRWRNYRESLGRAEIDLRRAMLAAPVMGEPAIGLAAARWELDPPPAGSGRDELVRLVNAGADLVPFRSPAQLRAADLLFDMGAPEEGVARLKGVLELDPLTTGSVVKTLIARGVEPAKVLELLPRTAAVLASLATTDLSAGAWLAAVESFEGPPSKGLLLRYGVRCREIGAHTRLRRHLELLGEQREPMVEVERLIQHADALLTLGDVTGAVADATRARSLDRQDVRAAEFLGTVYLRGGDAENAAEVFGDALRVAALGQRPHSERARLYRWLGQAQEARYRPDLAVDAYRHAVRLDSGEKVSRARLRALDSSFAVEGG